MMSEDLKPCPFCGGQNIEVHGMPAVMEAPDTAQCADCNACADAGTWNNRAALNACRAQAVPDGFAKEIARIADDYHACNIEYADVALDEMREALNSALSMFAAAPSATANCEFHGSDKAACEQYSGRNPCATADAVSVPRGLLERVLIDHPGNMNDVATLVTFNTQIKQAREELRALLAQSQGKTK